jgi:hypothetical protein
MRHLLLGLALLVTTADRTSDRDALLAADRTLSDKTAELGTLPGFLPAFTDDAAYLYPGAPLLRGNERIRSFLANTDSIMKQTWSPAFADVSADGRTRLHVRLDAFSGGKCAREVSRLLETRG